jgi:two-component system, NtrC family, response regulator PilR
MTDRPTPVRRGGPSTSAEASADKSGLRAGGGPRSPAEPAANAAANKPRILVVDDEPSMRDMLRIVLRRDGYDVVLAENGGQAIAILQQQPIDLLLSDIRMPDVSGVDVLRTAKALNRDVVAFMMTAFASTDTAVEAMRLGAVDYFTKPFNMDELRFKVRQHLEASRLKQENVLLKRALNTSHSFSNIIGRSEAMLAIFKMIETIARTSSTVLITGESGTGKDMVARAVHFNSLRRDHPFVALNCGAVPETLLESELFGHMRGAFTGADVNKKGLVEVAERGTIFLDEIGEMNASMQVKLLRVLQDRRFRRLGSTEEVEADIRVIAATNQDLPKLVADGRFREDLFYRLNVIPIHLPPLRDRREDIPLLADHFLAKYTAQMDKPIHTISREAQELLTVYAWPGNVRELENAIERAVALEPTAAILPESLPPHVRPGPSRGAAPFGVGSGGPLETQEGTAGRSGGPSSAEASADRSAPHAGGGPVDGGLPDLGEGFDLEARGEEFYRHYIALALERAGGVQTKAAELLGMSFRSFRYYAKKFNLR